MFTGIIEAIGEVVSKEARGEDLRLRFATGALSMSDVALGDSIAVNGVCLTVVSLFEQGFAADVSLESLRHTTIGEWRAGTRVNLEKALTLRSRLGGHLVSGHVDGVGRIQAIMREGRSWRYEVACPKSLLPYLAAKGSVTVDGVSLTVTAVDGDVFTLNIVPHTAAETIITQYKVGSRLHLEADLMARYAERLLATRFAQQGAEDKGHSGLSLSVLARNGFLR